MQNPYLIDIYNDADVNPYTSYRPTSGTVTSAVNKYDFFGTDEHGTYYGGGDPGEHQVRHQTPPPVREPSTTGQAPQGIYLSNGQYIPAFRVSDVTSTPGERTTYYYGNNDEERTLVNPAQFNIANLSSYFPGWTSLSPTNWQFFGGTNPDTWDTWDGNNLGVMVKTAGEEGTLLNFLKQGDYWVPDPNSIRTQTWDTNANQRMRNIAAALMATAGTLGYLNPQWATIPPVDSLFGGPIAGEAVPWGYTGGAAGVVPPATPPVTGGLPPELGGVEGVISGATAPPPPLADGLGTGFAGTEAAGAFGGAGAAEAAVGAGAAGAATQAAAGAVPAAAGAATQAAAGTSILDLIRNALGGASSLASLLSGASGNNNNSGSLLPLLASLYGVHANKEYAKDLKTIAESMRSDAQPYLDRLKATYDNLSAYFNSPDVQARLGLEANRLMGIDSSRGRLSNPIERDMLLQQYAARDINQYRNSLQGSIDKIYQPRAIAELLRQSSAADEGRYGDLAALLGKGGVSVSGIFDDIKKAIDAGKDIWDIIKGWWD